MSDDLPKDEKSSDDDAPAKVSFHSLKDEEEPEEEASKSVMPVEEKAGEPEEEPSLKKEIDGEYPLEDEEDEEPVEEEVGEAKEEIVDAPKEDEPEQYYLQVVKVGEQPEWPRPKEDLKVFSQPLDGGLIQYWAYLNDSAKTSADLPLAEDLAKKNSTGNAVIIIDQVCHFLSQGSCLELVLAKDNHALAKTDSNLENLESNISSLLDLGRQNFGIKVEHFMSTDRVSPEVEKRLDDLEEAEGNQDISEEKQPEIISNLQDNGTKMEEYNQKVTQDNKRSKLTILIPVLVLIIVFVGVIYYREKLISKFVNKINPPKPVVEVTPFPTPTLIPTPSVERSNFTVRVLNGTTVTGAAGVLAEKLKTKGWKIDKTGNATSSAIPESYVRAKPGDDMAIKVLLLDVSDYQGASSSSPLKLTDKADLEFVIGKK